MKTCTDCGITKDLDDFAWLWKKKNLHRSYCKICNVKRAVKWQKENKLRRAETSKKSYHKTYFINKYQRNTNICKLST